MKQTNQQHILRVWWIPQVPGKPFRVSVPDLVSAKLLLETLANYDLWQYEHNIKPDYCNAGGLEILEDGEWSDWYSEDGDDIDDLTVVDLGKLPLGKSS